MPEKTMSSELAIQTLFRARARIKCPAVAIVAVPNGVNIPSRAGRAKVRREGLATGFPDVVCFWAGPGIAAIEFKSATGRVAEGQKEWLARLNAMGIPATIARDPDAAVEFLRQAGAPFIDRVGRL